MAGFLLEVAIYVVARPMLGLVLGVFGYDLDWNPKDGRRLTGWRLALAAVLCFVISAVVLGGPIYLIYAGWFVFAAETSAAGRRCGGGSATAAPTSHYSPATTHHPLLTTHYQLLTDAPRWPSPVRPCRCL